MKRILLLCCVLLCAARGYAQQPSYTLGTSVGNVDCYYSLVQCDGKTAVLLRFDNRNQSPVTISWDEKFTTEQVPQKTKGYVTRHLVLPVGSSQAADCADMAHEDYIIRRTEVNVAYVADITGFEFSNVSVTP